jgi:hypothetical protein
VLKDAYYEGATASSGTLHYQAPDLTWKGSLRPGQRAVIRVGHGVFRQATEQEFGVLCSFLSEDRSEFA